VPNYFIALMVLFIVAYRLAWLPSSAAYDPHFEKGFNWDFILSVIQHGLLPAFSIAFGFVCRDLLSARMLVITTLGEDYLTFAEAKGLRPVIVMLRYALRNVYMPQVTALAIRRRQPAGQRDPDPRFQHRPGDHLDVDRRRADRQLPGRPDPAAARSAREVLALIWDRSGPSGAPAASFGSGW
jgi:binding-protein-dependent transport system inner membrane component